jgi:hypothetical protein
MSSWNSFFDSTDNCFEMAGKPYFRNLVTGHLAIFVMFTLFDIIACGPTGWNIACVFLRIVINVAMFPFTVLASPAEFVRRWKRLGTQPKTLQARADQFGQEALTAEKEHAADAGEKLAVARLAAAQAKREKEFRFLKIVASSVTFIFACALVAYIGFATWVGTSFRPKVVREFEYRHMNFTQITTADPAAVCRQSREPWTVTDIAAIALIAHNVDNADLIQNLSRTLLTRSDASFLVIPDDLIPGIAFLPDNFEHAVIAFQGVAHRRHLGVLMEVIPVQWLLQVVEKVIPYSDDAIGWLFSSWINQLSYWFMEVIVGLPGMPTLLLDHLDEVSQLIEEKQ